MSSNKQNYIQRGNSSSSSQHQHTFGYSQMYNNTAMPGTIAHNKTTGGQQTTSSNINQFEIILAKALEVQDQLIGSSKSVQKVSKQTKTFKDIAEALISQMHFIHQNTNNNGRTSKQKIMQQQLEDDMEVATISTQMGNAFEEESNQLKELIREKDSTIEMLTKEKNYYIRRCEQQLKTIQNQSSTQLSQQFKDQLATLEQDIQLKLKSLDEAQMTIKNQNEVIERQASYILQFDTTLAVLNVERESFQRRISELESDLQKVNQENQQVTNELETLKLNAKNAQQNAQNSQNTSTPTHDLARISQVQTKMLEQLVRENSSLNTQVKQLKEDPLMMNEFKQSDIISNNPRIVEIIQDIYFQIPSQRKNFGLTQGSTSLEDQLLDIKNFIDQKLLSTSIQPLAVSPNKMREPTITITNNTAPQHHQQQNITIPSQIKYDTKFCSLINVNLLDIIYRDFFQSQKPGSSTQDQIEIKNRSFKDLYNILEDSVLKFYDIFVKYRAAELKNQKLEETFIQLDTVFSNEQHESDDTRVLDELRNLNQTTLQQYFKLQQEIVELQALDGVSAQVLKLIKKSQDKSYNSSSNTHNINSNGSKSAHKQQDEIFALEQQVIELNIKLQDYERIIKQKERKQQKKLRQKSGGKSPVSGFKGGFGIIGNNFDYINNNCNNNDLDQSVNSQIYMNRGKSHQIKSLDRSLNSSHNYGGGFQNGLRFNIQNMNSNNLGNSEMKQHNINQQASNELQQNLNRALDKLYEQEEKLENLEKEKSVLHLDLTQMKNDYEKVLSQAQVQDAKYLEVTEQNLQLQGENQLMSREMEQMKTKIQSLSNEIEECQKQLLHCEKEIQEQSDKAKRIASLNEELRELITLERNAYNEEKLKLDENVDKCNLSWESKLKLVKNKLLMVLQNEGYMNDVRQSQKSSMNLQNQNEQLTFDQVIKMACDTILKIKSNTNVKPNPVPQSSQFTAAHSRQISISNGSQIQSINKPIQSQNNYPVYDISPIKKVNEKPYLTNNIHCNLNEISRISEQHQSNNREVGDNSIYHDRYDYNQQQQYKSSSGNNQQKTPQKYIMLQPVEQSTNKKALQDQQQAQNNQQQQFYKPTHHFDTFNEFQQENPKCTIEEDLQCINTSFHNLNNNGGCQLNNPYINIKGINNFNACGGDTKQNTQETDNLGLGCLNNMDFKSTQNSLNNFLHNTIQSQGPPPLMDYQNLIHNPSHQINKHHQSNNNNYQHQTGSCSNASTMQHSTSQKEFSQQQFQQQISSPQPVQRQPMFNSRTPNNNSYQYQYDNSKYENAVSNNANQMTIQQDYQAYTPTKNIHYSNLPVNNNHHSINNAPQSIKPVPQHQTNNVISGDDNNTMINQRSAKQHNSVAINTMQQLRQIDNNNNSDKPKRNINDILNSFKKEKESFNDKLSQLKSKLEAVKSPEPATTNSKIVYTGGNTNKDNKNIDYMSSPSVENRRAKTLQKLKGNFTKENDNDYSAQQQQQQQQQLQFSNKNIMMVQNNSNNDHVYFNYSNKNSCL